MFKSNISDIYSLEYTKIKIISDDDLRLKKTLNMQNVVIIISCVFQ